MGRVMLSALGIAVANKKVVARENMLTGSIVALVTPMLRDGQVDYPALHRLIDWHIDNGTDGIVSVGTTGESATLQRAEYIAVVEETIRYAAGRIPIIVGAGTHSTQEAIHMAQAAQSVGAQSLLSVVPYYNRPSQEGLYQHFTQIADAVDVPIILYNVPKRTALDMLNDTVLRLAKHPNIVGLKDATGDLARFGELTACVPEDFALYSGDDATAMAFMLCGGHGVISVCANVAPQQFRVMCEAALAGDLLQARQYNSRLQKLYDYLFIESSPAPTKWALSRLGLIENHLRLPLTPLSKAAVPILESVMKEAGVW